MPAYNFLFQFIRQYPHFVGATIVLSAAAAFLNGIGTALIIPILLELLDHSTTQKLPGVIQAIFRVLNLSADRRPVSMVALVLGILLLKNIASYLSTLTSAKLKRLVANQIRRQGINLLLRVDLDFLIKNKLGDLNNRLSNEAIRSASAIPVLVQCFASVITLTVFVGMLVLLSWQLTVISVGLMLFVLLINQQVIRRSKRLGQEAAIASREFAVNLLELLTGMRLVRTSSMEEREQERLLRIGGIQEDADFRAQANSGLIQPISEMTGLVAVFLIVLFSQYWLAQQVAAFSTILLTYLFLLFRTLPVLAQLNFARNQLANIVASVEMVMQLLRREDKPFMANGTIEFTHLRTGICFEDVTFAYPGQTQKVLNGVNLKLPCNMTLALVGTSGAGKSTLADLLPRFYDPTGGRITIDGQDLRSFDDQSLRRSMGIVSQDTFLFNASVRDNIAYGAMNATDDQIIQSAIQANAHDFILQLPQGYETVIGDRGVMLSGGQRQRLAIARAILQNPEILILDEATSALDSVSEKLVQEALEQLSRDRTTLIIAHRLSTIQKADQVAVMEKGRVIELGNHQDLLAKRGAYARLCKMQFAGLLSEQAS
jgi:ATP-binding cassette, subfamily B, bacterial MsbA